ncbi:PAS domain-containing protein [Tistlia consotensis]|uniref:PAS domain-containing protein n=1 Tax=Tistlia consotensis USBA 355 TaxID=560819 RepID=A0A1Y6CX23_9PROT|nr:PAS domain-containing protein [Tistlia consotensis]SMF80975.1 PAS domain-containing protein [Tistlia consotensis USBA 355]SNS22218.1 PAS domain-containing protein [Tistlia consotensis]
MAAQATFVDSIEDPRLRELYRYWDELRRGRIGPAYAEVDVLELPRRVLPFILLAEVVGEGAQQRYRFRLCGTEVEATFGRKMGGFFVDELSTGEYRAYMVGLYAQLVRTRRPIYSVGSYHGRAISTERLMLPLSDDGRKVDRVLSAQTFSFRKELPRVIMPIEREFDEEKLLQP